MSAVTTTRPEAPSTYHAMPPTPDCSTASRAAESWPLPTWLVAAGAAPDRINIQAAARATATASNWAGLVTRRRAGAVFITTGSPLPSDSGFLKGLRTTRSARAGLNQTAPTSDLPRLARAPQPSAATMSCLRHPKSAIPFRCWTGVTTNRPKLSTQVARDNSAEGFAPRPPGRGMNKRRFGRFLSSMLDVWQSSGTADKGVRREHENHAGPGRRCVLIALAAVAAAPGMAAGDPDEQLVDVSHQVADIQKKMDDLRAHGRWARSGELLAGADCGYGDAAQSSLPGRDSAMYALAPAGGLRAERRLDAGQGGDRGRRR